MYVNQILQHLSTDMMDLLVIRRMNNTVTVPYGPEGGFWSRRCRYIKVKQRTDTALAY